MIRRLSVIAALAGVCLSAPAGGACILCSCTVDAGPVSFGAYAPLSGGVLEATGTIDIDCIGIGTPLDSFAVKLGPGLHGAFAAREMRSGADPLPYNLYSDAARTIIWGDGTGGYSAVTINNTLSLLTWNVSRPVYGRIPPAPATPAGSYADTVLVTIEW